MSNNPTSSSVSSSSLRISYDYSDALARARARRSLSAEWHSLTSLLAWSFYRHRAFLFLFSIVQVIYSVAIVFGVSLMLGDAVHDVKYFVSIGVWVQNIVAVGITLTSSVLVSAIQRGLLRYQLNLPVSRVSLLLTDFVIWVIVALPGLIFSTLMSWLRFGIFPSISLLLLFLLLCLLLTCVEIGYALALWITPVAVQIVSQLFLFATLMFAPILYPADRLPAWLAHLSDFSPFVAFHRLMVACAYNRPEFFSTRYIVVGFAWLIACFALCYAGLKRRR